VPDHPALHTVVDVVDPEPYWTLLEERFGMPRSTFDGYALVQPGSKKLYIVPADHAPPVRPEADVIGMPFLRIKMQVPKLTTAAAMHFGDAATRNVIAADAEQAEAYLTQQDFTVADKQLRQCTGRGYVLIRHREWTLGVGFLKGTESGAVESMFPGGFARSEDTFSLAG
jgi:NOL1/NOP2/fmu family ribosome biogenesis protein